MVKEGERLGEGRFTRCSRLPGWISDGLSLPIAGTGGGCVRSFCSRLFESFCVDVTVTCDLTTVILTYLLLLPSSAQALLFLLCSFQYCRLHRRCTLFIKACPITWDCVSVSSRPGRVVGFPPCGQAYLEVLRQRRKVACCGMAFCCSSVVTWDGCFWLHLLIWFVARTFCRSTSLLFHLLSTFWAG
jgi:hypothetical protein